MTSLRYTAATLLLLCYPVTALTGEADVVYVTDELRLGLYASEDTSGRALKTLVSGARLEILERSLMSIRVRTEDGDQGWVKTAFVVDREPARRRVARIESELTETAAALAAKTSEVDELSDRIANLDADLASAKQGIEDLPELRTENATLRAALSEGGLRVPWPWLVVAVLIALVIGMAAGYRWLDRRVRRQFGGLKIY